MPAIDPVTSAAGIGLNLVGALGSAFGIKKANKRLDQLLAEDPAYAQNMYAQNQLGLAQTLFNGRMAGAGAQEQNIYNNQASTLGNIGRNSGDAARALALAGSVQGQTNDAFSNLGIAEAQNKYSLLNNLNNAYGVMIGEGDKMYNDQIRRYTDKVNVRNIQQQNRQSPWQSLMNLGSSIAGFGAAGGFNKPK
jgi:hypothetical protein